MGVQRHHLVIQQKYQRVYSHNGDVLNILLFPFKCFCLLLCDLILTVKHRLICIRN